MKIDIEYRAIDNKALKQMAKSLPVAYITLKQFKKLMAGRNDIDYSKIKVGQVVGIFRGHQLIIKQQIYIRYYNMKYSVHNKSKVGREMLISNMPLPKSKIVDR